MSCTRTNIHLCQCANVQNMGLIQEAKIFIPFEGCKKTPHYSETRDYPYFILSHTRTPIYMQTHSWISYRLLKGLNLNVQ